MSAFFSSAGDVALTVVLVLAGLTGLLFTALQLPGNWLILAAALVYDWRHGWDKIGWQWLLALTAVALAAEIVEAVASAAAVRRAGASRRAAVGALVGGFAGMILFSLPLPVIGTIAGGLIGCFVGAFIAELSGRPPGTSLPDGDLSRGMRAGGFAAVGRLFGLMAKLAAGFVIAGAAVGLALT